MQKINNYSLLWLFNKFVSVPVPIKRTVCVLYKPSVTAVIIGRREFKKYSATYDTRNTIGNFSFNFNKKIILKNYRDLQLRFHALIMFSFSFAQRQSVSRINKLKRPLYPLRMLKHATKDSYRKCRKAWRNFMVNFHILTLIHLIKF